MLMARQVFISFIFFWAFGFGCLFVLAGCGDESKTTGTQLQMSPEVKAEIEDMRSVQQQERALRRQERAGRRGGK
jgi:hypothetical protein